MSKYLKCLNVLDFDIVILKLFGIYYFEFVIYALQCVLAHSNLSGTPISIHGLSDS